MAWSSYFWVRSAGFSFEWLDHMSVLSHAPAVGRYEALRAEIGHLECSIVAAARTRAPEALAKLDRRFREGAVIKASELAQAIRLEVAPLLESRDTLLEQASQCAHGLQNDFAVELQRSRRALVEFLATPEAREALFLSNPEALQRIDALIANGVEEIDSRMRQRLRLGWNYAQRLCAKNDTSSFFGPIAWGRFVGPERPAIKVDACELPWLSSRKTFFEHWVVLRLGSAVNADPALRDSLPLSLNAGCHVASGILHFPLGQTRQLDALGAAMLEALAPQRGACVSREKILAQLTPQGWAEREVATRLDLLLAKKVVKAGFDIAPGIGNPLQCLQQALRGLDASIDTKAPWLSLFSRLEALRIDFETGALDVRVAALEAMRTALADAGVDLSRAQGQMYVGRFPVYEDCARNLHVELGGSLATTLQTDLIPVMELHCWLVSAVAVRLHDRYLACWDELHPDAAGDAAADFLQFFSLLSKQAHQDAVAGEIRGILRACWKQVCAQHPGSCEVALTVADLNRLLQLLHASEPRAKRFHALGTDIHSPDFMLAAKDLEAFERGDYRIVIGEVHPAVHTVSQPVAQPFCPYAEGIRREVQQVLAPRTVVLADSPQAYQRSHIDWLDVPALMQLVLPTGGGHVAPERILPAGRAEVFLRSGVLTLRDKQNGIEQDLLTVIPSEMHRICFALAGELLGQGDSRRLTLGRIVLKRRSWHLTGDALPSAAEPAESLSSYLAWRRWATDTGLPRHVFVKCDSEPKPVYVDFCNPLALDLLAALAKKREPMRFSEMCPAPDELWLTDQRGRYCSEFRTSHIRDRLLAATEPQQSRAAPQKPAARATQLQQSLFQKDDA